MANDDLLIPPFWKDALIVAAGVCATLVLMGLAGPPLMWLFDKWAAYWMPQIVQSCH